MSLRIDTGKLDHSSLIITVPLWIKILAVILFVGVWGNGLLRGLHELAEALSSFQNPYRWLLLVTFLVASPIVLLWILANRTEFTDTEIIHRNLLPTTTRKKYSEVSRVAVTRRAEVRIEFIDGNEDHR